MAGNRVVIRFIGEDRDVRASIDRVQSKLGGLTSSLGTFSALFVGGGSALAVLAPAAIAGVALAFGGLGVAIAAQNAKVQASFTQLKDHVVGELTRMAAPFVPVLLHISDLARATFDGIGGQLTAAFASAAPYVDRVAVGLAGLVTNIMPGLLATVRSAGPVIEVLSQGLSNMGTGLSQMFSSISQAGGPAAVVLQGLMNVVNGLLPIFGRLINDAATGFAPVFRALAPVVLMVADALGNVLGQAFLQLGPQIGRLIDRLAPLIAVILPQIARVIIGIVIPAIGQLIGWLANNVDAIQDFAMNTTVAFLQAGRVVLAFVSTTLGAMARVFAVLSLLPGQFGRNMGAAAQATFQAKGEVDRFRGTVDQMHSKAVDIRAQVQGTREVQDLINRIGAIPALKTITVRAIASVQGAISGIFGGGRAEGGPVRSGTTYLVGERGPEYLTMGSQAGHVTPNGGAKPGGAPTITFAGNTSDALATLIMQMIRTGKIQIT